MRNSQTAMSTVVTLLLAALIAVGGYFLAIQPQLAATEEAVSEEQAARDLNDQLDLQILAAQEKEKQIPMWQGEMDAIALDLPPVPNQSELNRLIETALAARGLPLVALTFGSFQLISPPVADAAVVPPVTPPVAGEAAESTPDPSPTPAPADTAESDPEVPSLAQDAPLIDGLVGAPVTVETEGDPTAIMQFIADLQAQTSRFLTVTNIEIARAEEKEEFSGRRALTTSDWTVSVTYLAFSLLDSTKSYPTEDPAANPAYGGGSIYNPFIPLEGSGL